MSENGLAVREGRSYAAIGTIARDPNQPRKTFSDEALKELADSIKAQGVIQDLIVRPAKWTVESPRNGFGWRIALNDGEMAPSEEIGRRKMEQDPKEKEDAKQASDGRLPLKTAPAEVAKRWNYCLGVHFIVIAGERRLRAARLAGLTEVPVSVRNGMDAAKITAQQLVENQQRENLSAMEEAAGIARMMKQGKTVEAICKELGLSRGTVFGRLVLTRLQAPVKKALEDGKISVSVAGLIAQVPTVELQEAALKEVRHEAFNFKEVQEMLNEKFLRQLRQAPFDTQKIYGTLPACASCPKRSGNIPEVETNNPNVCTDVDCFNRKRDAVNKEKLAAAQKAGQQVLSKEESAKIFNDWDGHDLRYSAPFVDVSKRCEPLGYEHKQHWKGTLGTKCPTPVLAVDQAGEIRELLPKDVAMKALKDAGLAKKVERESNDGYAKRDAAKEKKRRERCKRMDKVSAATSPKILEKAKWGELPWMKLLAEAAYLYTNIDVHATVAKRRRLAKTQYECRQKLEAWMKQERTPKELGEFIIDLLLCGYEYHSSNWSPTEWHPPYAAAAKLAGVDVHKEEEWLQKGQKKTKGTKKK